MKRATAVIGRLCGIGACGLLTNISQAQETLFFTSDITTCDTVSWDNGAFLKIAMDQINSSGIVLMTEANNCAKWSGKAIGLPDDHPSLADPYWAFRSIWGEGETGGEEPRKAHPRVRAVPGNHDYMYGTGVQPFHDMFGNHSEFGSLTYGEVTNHANWTILGIDGNHVGVNQSMKGVDGTDANMSPDAWNAEMNWAAKRLSQTGDCTLVFMHEPRYSSGVHGDDSQLNQLWQLFYDNGVDLVLTGHDHFYERFAPMNSNSGIDQAYGVVEIIAGTGGAALRGPRQGTNIGTRCDGTQDLGKPSQCVVQDKYGFLEIVLNTSSMTTTFVTLAGERIDPHTIHCHGRPQ